MVAHFHYTVFGTVVFDVLRRLYYWWPKMTGRMLDERLGKIHFWLLFVGFQVTFLIQHWLGVKGMPRRYGDYLAADHFELFNQISTVGSAMLGAIHAVLHLERRHTWRRPPGDRGRPVGLGRPPRVGDLLPASAAQLRQPAPIRSERPAFDLHHPQLAAAGAHATPAKPAAGGTEGDEFSARGLGVASDEEFLVSGDYEKSGDRHGARLVLGDRLRHGQLAGGSSATPITVRWLMILLRTTGRVLTDPSGKNHRIDPVDAVAIA